MFKLMNADGKTAKISETHSLHDDLKMIVNAARRGEAITLPESLKPFAELKLTGELTHGDNTFTLPAGYTLTQWSMAGNVTLPDEKAYDVAVRAVQTYNLAVETVNPLAHALGTLPVNPFIQRYAPRGRKAGERTEKVKPTKETGVIFE